MCCSKILAVQLISSCVYNSYYSYNACIFHVLLFFCQELASFKIDCRDGAGTQLCIHEHHSQNQRAYFHNSSRRVITWPPVEVSTVGRYISLNSRVFPFNSTTFSKVSISPMSPGSFMSASVHSVVLLLLLSKRDGSW